MRKKTLFYIILLLSCIPCRAQHRDSTVLRIGLREALEIAASQSLDAIVCKDQLRISYWQYRNYKADLRPEIIMDGALPSLNKSLTPYQRADGSYEFIPNRSLTGNLGLAVSQNIPFTGGKIYLQSQIERIEQLDGNKRVGWLSVPAAVTLEQPLITDRPLWWAMKIEPARYKEAQQQFVVNMEIVSIKTIQYYFDLLLAMVNRDIAEQNLENATKLFDIASGKKRLGLISDNDLQQLKLGKLNASAAVITARQNYDARMFALRNYLGFNDRVTIEASVPPEAPDIPVGLDEVVEHARENNPITHNSRRRLLEAQHAIAQARANRGFQANVYVSVGFTGSAAALGPSYENLQNRQIVSLGVRIPILDWGKGKGRIQLAKSQAEVVKTRVEQEKLDFEQNIVLAVQEYLDQQRLTSIYRQANEVAQHRYKTAFETFVIGKINVIDINTAQSEEDNAKRNYINQLYSSWLCYYNLRQITLFDFETRSNITYDLY